MKWIAVFAILFGGVGLVIASMRPPEYRAALEFVLDDAGVASSTSETFLADQTEILTSSAVAQEAVDLLAGNGISLTVRDFARRTSVEKNDESNFVTITFTGSSPEEARTGTATYLNAYRAVLERRAMTEASQRLEEIDAALVAVNGRLAELDADIAESRSESGALLESEINEAIIDLAGLRAERDRAVTDAQRTRIQAELDLLRDELQLLQVLRALEVQSPELGSLLAERQSEADQRSTLADQRASVVLQSETAGSTAVVLSDTAQVRRSIFGSAQIVLIATALGALAGLAAVLLVVLVGQRRVSEARELGIPSPEEPAWLPDEYGEAQHEGGLAGLARYPQVLMTAGLGEEVPITTAALNGSVYAALSAASHQITTLNANPHVMVRAADFHGVPLPLRLSATVAAVEDPAERRKALRALRKRMRSSPATSQQELRLYRSSDLAVLQLIEAPHLEDSLAPQPSVENSG